MLNPIKISQLIPGARFSHPVFGKGVRAEGGHEYAPRGYYVNLRLDDGTSVLVHGDTLVECAVVREVHKIDIESSDYVIRFAKRWNRGPAAKNLPIAFVKAAWDRVESFEHGVPDRWTPVSTLTGQRLEIRRADCGLGCRCALEWRPA